MTQEHHEEHRPYADEGELRATLDALRNQIAASDERHTADHNRIETQVLKTNGRVTRLEMWKYAVMAVVSLLVLEVGWLISLGVIK